MISGALWHGAFWLCIAFAGLGLATQAPAALTQSYQATGNLDVIMVGVQGSAAPTISGTFSPVLPPGAVPVQAFVYTADWQSPGGNPLDLTFAGAPVLPDATPVTDSSSSPNLHGYRWDVSLSVLAPGPYSFGIGSNGNGSQIFAAALLIVYSLPSLPSSTVVIHDGALQVGEGGAADTESTTFSALPAGPTDLWIFTQADGGPIPGAEQILYNSNVVGGPIDGNLGLNGSVFNISTTSLAGSNTAAVTSTGLDHYGWDVAVVVVTPPPAAVPELPTAGLIVFAALLLAAATMTLRAAPRPTG
jgi:hypothetical protein